MAGPAEPNGGGGEPVALDVENLVPGRLGNDSVGGCVRPFATCRFITTEIMETHRHTRLLSQYFIGMKQSQAHAAGRIRVGQAAEMLQVSVETLRRWEADGRLRMERSEGGQRLVGIDEVARLLDERRKGAIDRPIVAQSARNRFPGVVTRVERDGVAAVVEVISGPHRLVSLMTAEAVEELDLKVGDEAVCVIKSTNVIVEIPSSRESRA
jgi:molybdopterin-binding protein